ncbi:MAG: hypothetical protein K6C30_08845 [Bacteroidaceae bacterium]|nr:hypothetical protein [Bacteroidaceae bacterium]
MHRLFLTIGLYILSVCIAAAQTPIDPSSLSRFVASFSSSFAGRREVCKLEDFRVDNEKKQIHVYANEVLGWYSFDRAKVEQTYEQLRNLLPSTYQSYQLCLYTKGRLIEELVLGGWDGDEERNWNKTEHHGNPWVSPLNRPYSTKNGLDGRHLSICSSHGKYFSQDTKEWIWQRPRLFCTSEDLLSQTFVVPFLIPMLENAGAIVFSPRERDWQRNEIIVDNDYPERNGSYSEDNGHHHWEDAGLGFAQTKEFYLNGDNPFADGTSRKITTQSRKSQTSTITWTPTIPADGRYAVYISYTTLPTSVQDAVYTVSHRGTHTSFRVNQQMGGGTWVYLGTFDFAAGNSPDNCVTLSNHSAYRGHISADAVRFGGGTGNIARGASTGVSLSGLPRFLEGARYAAQWAGFPQWVYGNKGLVNDYSEDINVRSLATNHLSRGSAYLPFPHPWVKPEAVEEQPAAPEPVRSPKSSVPEVLRQDTTNTLVPGLSVPIELSVALHTDAGYTRDLTTIGSLGIYTSDFCEGRYPSKLNRMASRDLCDLVLSQVTSDLQATFGSWTRRQMYDRNYSETREPEVPSIILEMLSHQNYRDLCLGHDPTFKFALSRAVYKGILRFVHAIHGSSSPVVQPLPVTALGAYITPGVRQIKLSWLAVEDPLEPTAMPDGFVVYHATGDGDFDNGTYVEKASYELDSAEPNVLHRFKVAACNAGGRSMDSEEVCAFLSMSSDRHAIIIDAFDRLAGPQPVDNDTIQGFDMKSDPGVPMARMAGYCGQQICFDKKGLGREGYGATGYSTAELEGMILAGNSRDWTTCHARDIVAATDGNLSISSCTASAVVRADFDSRVFALMDIIFGAEKADGYSLHPSKVFPPKLVQVAAEFARSGGSLLVSGAYVGADMTSDADRLFTRSLLKYEFAGSLLCDSIAGITSNDGTFDLPHQLNEQYIYTPSADCLAPTADAFCPMVYGPSGQSAAVAYDGHDYRSLTLGFPLENITDTSMRRTVFRNFINFLIR